MNVNDIVKAIRRGDLDEGLATLGHELNARYKAKRAEAVRSFEIGDRVRVLDHPGLRRKNQAYWIGHEGTVVGRNQQTINVDMGEAGILRVPGTLLETVAE